MKTTSHVSKAQANVVRAGLQKGIGSKTVHVKASTRDAKAGGTYPVNEYDRASPGKGGKKKGGYGLKDKNFNATLVELEKESGTTFTIQEVQMLHQKMNGGATKEDAIKWLMRDKVGSGTTGSLKELTTEFHVRDALGGSVTGDYKRDLKRLKKKGQTVSKKVYDEAHQMGEQP